MENLAAITVGTCENSTTAEVHARLTIGEDGRPALPEDSPSCRSRRAGRLPIMPAMGSPGFSARSEPVFASPGPPLPRYDVDAEPVYDRRRSICCLRPSAGRRIPGRVDRSDVAEMILVDGHERPYLSRLGIVDPSRLEDGI